MIVSGVIFWIVIAILLYVDRVFFVESSLEYSETAFPESGEVCHIHQKMYLCPCVQVVVVVNLLETTTVPGQP